MTEQDSIKHWYAFKIFFSKGEPVKEYFASKGMEYFYEVKKAEKTRDGRKIMVEEPVIPSLIFLYATQTEAEKQKPSSLIKSCSISISTAMKDAFLLPFPIAR